MHEPRQTYVGTKKGRKQKGKKADQRNIFHVVAWCDWKTGAQFFLDFLFLFT
jgi:hypothetical protein